MKIKKQQHSQSAKKKLAGRLKAKDITDQLNDLQLKELETLASENVNKNIITLQEFARATGKWRLK